jgi:hypothetical protein
MMVHKRIVSVVPNLTFWATFLLLNLLLFLPIYFFFRADTSFWPLERPFAQDPAVIGSSLFLQRTNLDIFRLNIEWLLLIALAVFVKPFHKRWYLWISFVFFLAQLGYALYEGFIRSYYLLEPIIYNDFFLFLDGATYVLRNLHLSWWQYAGGGLLVMGVIGGLFWLNNLLFTAVVSEKLTKATRLLVIGLFISGLVSVSMWKEEAGGVETAVSSFTAKLNQNIKLSRDAKAVSDRFDSDQLSKFYQFTQESLRVKPDIYIIFVESYGSILYKRPDFLQSYERLLGELDTQLSAQEWAVASTQSVAPTWGGGSWISYTSAVSGLRLDSHAQYLAMFNRYSNEPFPHLFNYLRTQGYRSYRLSANSDVLNDIEWQRYKNFYGIDEWLRFNDLHYEGPLFGWGPSPPDQYAINFAHEYMNQDGETPHVFFYITQNSHYPWTPLPQVAPDWQALQNEPPFPLPSTQTIPHAELRQHYLASIQYELTFLVDFITKEADENDIFIIVGDHQPARVARYTDGWETPMHVISKNSDLVESFYAYGFVPGLSTRSLEPTTMRHEGFYSLFMRLFLQQYGVSPDNVPAYMPKGIPLN